LGSAFDPLSAPGGLIPHGGLLNATSRHWLNERYEDGPPRKRINRGLSEDVPNIPRSPPEIRRIGHRHHILAIGPDAIFLSSVGVQLLEKEANRVEFEVGGHGREVVGGISLMLTACTVFGSLFTLAMRHCISKS